MKKFDPAARGSDTPRSLGQYLARKLGAGVVSLLRLNGGGFFSTEVVQQIQSVCRIETEFGDILCRGGHGRLRWRAETFYTEEPQTVEWLGRIGPDAVFWDVGANVGLYSLYPAKKVGCRVLAFEPEAQNFALLMENISLNGLQEYVRAANIPLTRKFGVGTLLAHELTKGGAHNSFISGDPETGQETCSRRVKQVQFGVSMDELVFEHGFDCPSHVKIDVDGIEPEIIAGADKVLSHDHMRHLLIEVETNIPEHLAMVTRIKEYGFCLVAQRSNWESREDRTLENTYPMLNMVFEKN
jgi:FkbM family methyltransferase